MNDLETRGLKDLIKEYIEDETDIKTRLDDMEEDIRELQNPGTNQEPEEDEEMSDQEDEPEDDELPEEEQLEDNPERQEYEENIEKANQKPSGTRLSKEDMGKLQKTPVKKLRPEPIDDQPWDEE